MATSDNIFDAYQEIFAGADSDAELEEGSDDEDNDGGDIGHLLASVMCGERQRCAGERQASSGDDPQPSTSGESAAASDGSWQMGDRPKPDCTFTGQSGITEEAREKLGDDPSFMDFLRLMIPPDFFDQLSQQTNL